MKIGDIVWNRDGSFALELTVEGLKNTHLASPGIQRNTLWRVVGTELDLPGETFLGDIERNDTIIQGVSDPKRTAFVRAEQLEYQLCPTCNRAMERK